MQIIEQLIFSETLSSGQRLYRKRKQAGICTQCGKVPPKPNRVSCDKCLKAAAVSTKRAARARKEKGLCVHGTCPTPPNFGQTMCQQHLDEMNARQRQRDVERKAKGLCRQCGKPSEFKLVVCTNCVPRTSDIPPIYLRRELRQAREREALWLGQRLTQQRKEFIRKYLAVLPNDKMKEIALRRLGDKATLREVGLEHGVTRERIRQLEVIITRILASAALEQGEVNIPIPKVAKYCQWLTSNVQSASHE